MIIIKYKRLNSGHDTDILQCRLLGTRHSSLRRRGGEYLILVLHFKVIIEEFAFCKRF